MPRTLTATVFGFPLAVSIVALMALGVAGETRADLGRLTLADAVSRALRDGPAAKVARLESDRADDSLSAAESSYWPTAGIGSQAGYSNRLDDTLVASNGSGQVHTYGLATLGTDSPWFDVYIRQLLVDLDRWESVKRSELEVEAAQVSEAQRREEITFQVLQQYVSVLQIEDSLRLERDRVKSAEWLDRQATLLLDAGRCLPAERERVGLDLAEAQLQVASRAEELRNARHNLWLAIGADANSDLALDATSVPAASDAGTVAERVEGAPELRLLDLRRRIEETRADAHRSEAYYPKVGVVAGYRHYGAKRYDNYPDEVHVGLDVQLTLFDGFRSHYEAENATKAAEIARLQQRNLLETKRVRIDDLTRKFGASRTQEDLAQRRARLAGEELRSVDVLLQHGQGTLSEALSVRARKTREDQAAIDAHYGVITLWASLQREAGLLATTVGGNDAAPPAGD